MNTQWLRKQAINFIDSPKDDVFLFDMQPEVRIELEKRGLTYDDFSLEIGKEHAERKAKKAVEEEALTKPMAVIPRKDEPAPNATRNTTQRPTVGAENTKRVTSPSGTRPRQGESKLDQMMNDAVNKRKGI